MAFRLLRHSPCFERAWKRKLIGVWKREFQRRGAPHYHILMVPPHGTVNGLGFREWLSQTWASIVGAQRCEGECVGGCCEYALHRAAGRAGSGCSDLTDRTA